MAMISINRHDWSALEAAFDESAAAAGKPKGTLAYYGHKMSLPAGPAISPELAALAKGFGERAALELDQCLRFCYDM